MLPLKIRRRILNKLAQAVPGSPASPPSPTSPTSPNAPTEPSSTMAIKKAPSGPASDMMNLSIGWGAWTQYINSLVGKLDKAIITGTEQKYNFNDLFQNKFPSGVDTNYAPPNPTKDLIAFGRLIFQNIMNNGVPFTGPLKNEDMRAKVDLLLGAPELTKLQQVNQAGPLRNVGVDLSTVRSDLLTLKNSIPVA